MYRHLYYTCLNLEKGFWKLKHCFFMDIIRNYWNVLEYKLFLVRGRLMYLMPLSHNLWQSVHCLGGRGSLVYFHRWGWISIVFLAFNQWPLDVIKLSKCYLTNHKWMNNYSIAHNNSYPFSLLKLPTLQSSVRVKTLLHIWSTGVRVVIWPLTTKY